MYIKCGAYWNSFWLYVLSFNFFLLLFIYLVQKTRFQFFLFGLIVSVFCISSIQFIALHQIFANLARKNLHTMAFYFSTCQYITCLASPKSRKKKNFALYVAYTWFVHIHSTVHTLYGASTICTKCARKKNGKLDETKQKLNGAFSSCFVSSDRRSLSTLNCLNVIFDAFDGKRLTCYWIISNGFLLFYMYKVGKNGK